MSSIATANVPPSPNVTTGPNVASLRMPTAVSSPGSIIFCTSASLMPTPSERLMRPYAPRTASSSWRSSATPRPLTVRAAASRSL